MSSSDIAEEIRNAFPGTEEIVIQYLSGYLVDDAGEDEDILHVARKILASVTGDCSDALENLILKLGKLLGDQMRARAVSKGGPKLLKLDKAMDMSKNSTSSTIALSETVDLESVNKGKCVYMLFC